MEALSSGLACAIADNTGQRDIVRPGNSIALRQNAKRQREIGNTDDWGEPDVEELVAAMETAYAGRSGVTREAARTSMSDLTWKKSITNLLGTINQCA
jgi:glycosyltransferase involved in cell wall biosynthesis